MDLSVKENILREVIRLKDMEIDIWNENSPQILNLHLFQIQGPKFIFRVYNFFKDLPELLYKSRKRFYNDNEEEISFFVELLGNFKKVILGSDVMIFNDWQTSMLPLLLQE